MVAVVMTVDVAFFLRRHWIKFVGVVRCVDLRKIAVPSGDFLMGLRIKRPMDGSCAWWVSCESRSSLQWLSVFSSAIGYGPHRTTCDVRYGARIRSKKLNDSWLGSKGNLAKILEPCSSLWRQRNEKRRRWAYDPKELSFLYNDGHEHGSELVREVVMLSEELVV
jgi:hypothetical protein